MGAKENEMSQELQDPCLGCEAREITHGCYCSDCGELAAEAAAERAHEGEPPASLRELHERAWADKQALRGFRS